MVSKISRFKKMIGLVALTSVLSQQALATTSPLEIYDVNSSESPFGKIAYNKPFDGKLCGTKAKNIEQEILEGMDLYDLKNSKFTRIPTLETMGKYYPNRNILTFLDTKTNKTIGIHFIGGIIGYVEDSKISQSYFLEQAFCSQFERKNRYLSRS